MVRLRPIQELRRRFWNYSNDETGADMTENLSPWLANSTVVDTSPPRDPNDDDDREEEEDEEGDEEDQDKEPPVVREPDE